MNRTAVVVALSLTFLFGLACSSSGNNTGAGGTTGTAGTSGGAGTTGSAGTTGGAGTTGTAGTTGAGGGNFMAVLPCGTSSSYSSSGNTVNFGLITVNGTAMLTYDPKCLKVSPGSTVSFTGDFLSHPLTPSVRGTQGSPITSTSAGTAKSFTFPNPGFFAYYCAVHDPSDTGMFMSGVIWVQ
jgi:plastocyanin